MQSEERRSFVRGNFSFNVKFKTMTKDEYEDLKKSNEAIFPPFNQEQDIEINDREMNDGHPVSASLINHLVQIDQKLDQILDLLSKDKTVNGMYNQGVGLNISGSGMKIMVDSSLEHGRIIHTKFYLSKSPLIYMDIFGEVVHVMQVDNKDGETHYNLGIKFLDLSINDRERIISSVFQRQRGSIRKIKSVL
jgi:c-di-GMP-binding flagellar brake protein YcgR